MSVEEDIKKFNKKHPWPGVDGIKSLYRFHKIDTGSINFLEELFLNGKLYHALPTQFNDPFECRPHFNWPSNPNKVRDIRKRLIKVARDNGSTKKEAEKIVSENMSKEGFVENIIYKAIQNTFRKMRICCFTKSKDNLLFWAHYADSHKGFCIEYDATIIPIKLAFKVTYENEYPEVEYPRPEDARGLEPALIKSKDWEYENEYRTIYIPEAQSSPPGDGISMLLPKNAIKNIYFGSDIEESNKKMILKLISKGPFNPQVWQASLSKSSFYLEFINESSNSA